MKRLVARWTLAASLTLAIMILGTAPLALAQGGEHGDGTQDDAPPAAEDPYAPERGAAVYAEFCQACHGPRGESIASGAAFAAIHYDPETTRQQVEEGVDSDPTDNFAMPPYAQTHGGLLSGNQIDELMAYMETWDTPDSPPLPEPNIHASVDSVPDVRGDPQIGAAVYARFCLGCHGEQGEGRVPPNFPPLKVTDSAIQVVRDGSQNVFMPAFGTDAGGPLGAQQLDDLNAYMASWSIQPPEESPSPKGYNTLLIITGVAAILAVGGAYIAQSGGENDE